MLKMRIVLFLALVCLSATVKAEDPKAEPESAAEPEPAAEPESTHGDAKHSGSSTSETKAAKNLATAPWAFSIPAILALTAVAKYIL